MLVRAEVSHVWTILAYLTRHMFMEYNGHIESGIHDYDISVYEEEGGCNSELALPEKVDLSVKGYQVFKEDDHCECHWQCRSLSQRLSESDVTGGWPDAEKTT